MDRKQLETALRNAHAAGDTSAATKLAGALQNFADQSVASAQPAIDAVSGAVEKVSQDTANDIRKVGENLTDVPSPKRALDVAAEGLAEGLGGIFGLPVDAINSALSLFDQGVDLISEDAPNLSSPNPFMGSHGLANDTRNVFKKFGIEPDDAKLGSFIENVIQIGSATVAPTGGVLGAAKGFANKNPVAKSISESPKTFIAGEAASAGGAAVGRTTAEQVFPESDTAGMIGELIGSPTGALLEASIRTSKDLVNVAKDNLTADGANNKASREIQDAMEGTKEDALNNLNNATDTPLSGGSLTNDPGLIA